MYLSGDALTLPMPKVRGVLHKKEAVKNNFLFFTAPFLISYTLYLIPCILYPRTDQC